MRRSGKRIARAIVAKELAWIVWHMLHNNQPYRGFKGQGSRNGWAVVTKVETNKQRQQKIKKSMGKYYLLDSVLIKGVMLPI